MMQTSTALVLGGGSWGTTAAHLLSHNLPTTLWARDPEVADEVSTVKRNSRYLPGAQLHADLEATTNLEEAVELADLVVVAVPTSSVREVAVEAATSIRMGCSVVSLVKGFEPETNMRITDVLRSELGERPVGLLTGPNLSKEILAGKPASGVVAFSDRRAALRVQRLFTTPTFRVFTNPDVVGCELGGALKNVYVIAVGIVEGLDLGDNARGAVMTRSLAELTALSVAMGGAEATLAGLAGMGDLMASCMSPQSRNAIVGRALGQGRLLDEVVAELGQVAEGVQAVRAVHELSEIHGVSMPIAELVYDICWRDRKPVEAVAALLEGRLGSE